jgi:RimJ/RimL family protein N-acetyltransferase
MDVALSQDLWDDELALLVAASTDPDITRETYLPPNMTLSQAKKWFLGQRWGYFVLVDGKPAGMILMHPKPSKRGTVEIETWLLDEYRGRGVSRQGYRLIMDEAARWFDRVIGWVWETNTGSMQMLTVTGFVPTGREYELDGNKCIQFALNLGPASTR